MLLLVSAVPSDHNGNCFWCMTENIGFDFDQGYQRLSIIDNKVDNHYCTFKHSCTAPDQDLNWKSCEKGISTCLLFQREHLGTYVVNDVQGIGNASEQIAQEQLIEFTVDASKIRTV